MIANQPTTGKIKKRNVLAMTAIKRNREAGQIIMSKGKSKPMDCMKLVKRNVR